MAEPGSPDTREVTKIQSLETTPTSGGVANELIEIEEKAERQRREIREVNHQLARGFSEFIDSLKPEDLNELSRAETPSETRIVREGIFEGTDGSTRALQIEYYEPKGEEPYYNRFSVRDPKTPGDEILSTETRWSMSYNGGDQQIVDTHPSNTRVVLLDRKMGLSAKPKPPQTDVLTKAAEELRFLKSAKLQQPAIATT